jgi:hypothetical protein
MNNVQYGDNYEVSKEVKVEPVGFGTHAEHSVSSHVKNKRK